MADPEVQLLGTSARRWTVSTDGQTTRLRTKPSYGQQEGTPSWPATREGKSPWLADVPTSLPSGTTLITDGERSWIKVKPRLGAEGDADEDFTLRTTTTTTTTTPAPTTPPPTTPPPTTPPPTTPPPTTPDPTTTMGPTTTPNNPTTTPPPDTTLPPDP